MEVGEVLPWLILICGVAYLAVLGWGPAPLRYLLKPGTMLLIILMAWQRLDASSPYDWLILLGLVFSVAGDIFLALPRDRFLQGLAAFFIAHLLYIGAFTVAAPLTFGWRDVVEVAGLGLIAYQVFVRLRPGVLARRRSLLLPVALYTAVISLMVWRALALGLPLGVAGAGLFYLSDAILAFNRFGKPFPGADHAVMTTYYAAQYCLALTL